MLLVKFRVSYRLVGKRLQNKFKKRDGNLGTLNGGIIKAFINVILEE
jgi:hypothetical protein